MTATNCMTREIKTYPNSAFATKEEYLVFRESWKTRARAKSLLPREILLRCLLLGKDPWEAMPPTRNPRRIRNGALHDSGIYLAAKALKFDLKQVEQEPQRVASGKPLREWEKIPHWLNFWLNPTELGQPAAVTRAQLAQALVKLQTFDFLKPREPLPLEQEAAQ